jgi:hypothetical protein
MKPESLRLFVIVVFVLLVGISCNLSTVSSAQPTPTDFGVLYTQAASTFIAQMTESYQQSSATPQIAAATDTLAPSATPLAPTETLPPSPTFTLLPSFTPLPTSTPLPTATSTLPPGATPVAPPPSGGGGSGGSSPQVPCNAAQFIKDVTVPDGKEFPQGESFTKTWRLKNVGSCNWTKDYRIVFVSGDSMGAPTDGEPLPYSTKPGQTVDAAVDLVAPGVPGTYKGSWMLSSPSGQRFGTGPNHSNSFFVSIKVTEADSGSIYNFATNYCAASWKSSVADLSCPGAINDPDGFVLYFTHIALENQTEDEPTLWTNPDTNNDGYIKGTYPEIELKSGDRFLADVGCIEGYEKCDVVFKLKYINDAGKLKDIGEWQEVYDGNITRINIDLTSLVDNIVQLVLVVDANGKSKEDAAFWLNPHIERP